MASWISTGVLCFNELDSVVRIFPVNCATPQLSDRRLPSVCPYPKEPHQDIEVPKWRNMPGFRSNLPIARVSGLRARRDTSPPRMQNPKSLRVHQKGEAEPALNPM